MDCPIWKTPATVTQIGDHLRVNSARTDGEYLLSETATALVQNLSIGEKARLTTWLVDQRRLGDSRPLVTTETLRAMASKPGMKITERRNRLFRLLGRDNPTPSYRFAIGGQVTEDIRDRVARMNAWTEASDERDLPQLVRMLVTDGLLTTEGDFGKIFFTSKGFEHLEALEGANPDSQQAFIAMWFDDSMAEAGTAIADGIRDAGYTPMIISQKEHNRDITDEIIAEIRRSRFIVADFTCGVLQDGEKVVGIQRGGVYFEAGLAFGLGLEVIWCCRKDRLPHLHFDTRQRGHVDWESPEELRTRLARRIGAVIGYGPTATVSPTTSA